MLQGRNNRFSIKNKSKLIINRQAISHQRSQTAYDNPFLYIKHIEIYHQERLSPFHIRKVPSPLDKRQWFCKRQNSKQNNHKPKLYEFTKASSNSVQKESKKLTQEEKQQSPINVENLVDNLIVALHQMNIVSIKDRIFNLSRNNLKLLLKTLIEDQLFIQVKIKNILKKLIREKERNPSINKIIQEQTQNKKNLTIETTINIHQVFHINKPVQKRRSTRQSINEVKQTPPIEKIQKLQKDKKSEKKKKQQKQDKEQTKINQKIENTEKENQNQIVVGDGITTQLQSGQIKATDCSQLISPEHEAISQEKFVTSSQSSIQYEETECQKFLNKFDETQFQEFKQEHFLLLEKYVQDQPNKIIQKALIDHKAIQQQMLGYVDMLNISKYGVKTYIAQVNISALDNLIDGQLKKTNKYIIQGQDSILQKCRSMRDFITITRQRYDKILKQMMTVIDKKTQFCRQFVTKVHKWGSNYFLRKQYLQSLKKDYCEDLFFFYVKVKKVFLKLRQKRQKNKESISELEDALQKIKKMDELILIGNNFY